MEINDILNKDFVKLLNFVESYEGLFTQQIIIKANVSYYVKISHFLNVLRELNVVNEVEIEGTGNIKLFKFNEDSYVYKQIKMLMSLIVAKETNWTSTDTSDIFSTSNDGNWHDDVSSNK